jgi:hypothetical protein
MKKFTTAIVATTIALGIVSCKKELIGEGPMVTSHRTVSTFTALDLQMNGNVYYSEAPDPAIEITAKESIHGILETVVIDNRLVIRYTNGKIYDADPSIRINVKGPGVQKFSTANTGIINAMTDVHGTNIYLFSGGAGDIHMKGITATNLHAETKVSGSLNATSGTVATVRLKTSASGTINVSGVASRTATAHTSGSGDIRVKVSDHLDATITGSGSIYFTGYPTLSSHLSGTGDLIRL